MTNSKLNTKLLIYRIFALSIACFGMGFRILSPLFGDSPMTSLYMLGYFTIQTGIMVCALFLLLIIGQIKHHNNSTVSPVFRGAIMLYSLITSLVFLALLSTKMEAEGLSKFVLYLNHGFVALLLMIDSLITVPPGSYKWNNIFKWMIYPFVYLIFSVFELNFLCRTRYFFLDYHQQGPLFYFITLALMVIAFVVLSIIIIQINKYKKKV